MMFPASLPFHGSALRSSVTTAHTREMKKLTLRLY